MGSFTSPEKKPLQRKPATQEAPALGKSAQPPAFELTAEADAQKPAQLQEAVAPKDQKADEQQVAPQVAEASTDEPKKEPTEADRLRDAVAGKANEWNGKEFMTQQEIEDVRVASGLKNYTTCLEFAGKMMRDADKEVYGKDQKMATATSQMFTQTKADWERAVGERIQADAFDKSVALFEKALVRVEAQKAKVVEEITALRLPQKEGEKELAFKQRHLRAAALEKHTIPALDSVLRLLTSQRDKWKARSTRSDQKADDIDAQNSAMIKAEDGMTNGRPKPGEFIILAQAPGGAKYGVKKETQVQLAGGAFKHIAVFMEVLKQDDGSGYELWRTIDGGGTNGKETLLRVRLADRMIFPGQEGAKMPEVGSASGSVFAGWMNMDEIVNKRDAKLAAGKK